MRLKCEVDVVLRLVPGCNVRKTSRTSQAFITVGKEGGSQSKEAKINMLISTGKNRNGTKYLVCVTTTTTTILLLLLFYCYTLSVFIQCTCMQLINKRKATQGSKFLFHLMINSKRIKCLFRGIVTCNSHFVDLLQNIALYVL